MTVRCIPCIPIRYSINIIIFSILTVQKWNGWKNAGWIIFIICHWQWMRTGLEAWIKKMDFYMMYPLSESCTGTSIIFLTRLRECRSITKAILMHWFRHRWNCLGIMWLRMCWHRRSLRRFLRLSGLKMMGRCFWMPGICLLIYWRKKWQPWKEPDY